MVDITMQAVMIHSKVSSVLCSVPRASITSAGDHDNFFFYMKPWNLWQKCMDWDFELDLLEIISYANIGLNDETNRFALTRCDRCLSRVFHSSDTSKSATRGKLPLWHYICSQNHQRSQRKGSTANLKWCKCSDFLFPVFRTFFYSL